VKPTAGFRLPASGFSVALGAAVFLSCATPSAMKEGHPVLTGVDFEGNHSQSAKELRSKIATESTSGWFSKTVRYFDADLFEIDKKRIERFYQAKGFFQAKVEGVDVQRDNEGRVSLKVHLKEGPRVTISNFHIEGMEALKPNEQKSVNKEAGLQPGDGYDEDDYELAKLRALAELRERGFAEAKVDGKVEIELAYNRAQITLLAETGPRYKFGKVQVVGNRAIPSEAITRASGLEKGDQYKPSALELAQQHVYNLGTFAGVRVGLEPLPSGDPIAPVRISVREAPFQTVRMGVGFQIETERYEIPRLRAEYTNRNLFGGLRRLEVVATGGYAFAPSIFDRQKTGIVLNTSAQITVPNVFFPSLDWINRGEYTRDIQSSFDYQRVAARFSLLYRRGKHSIQPGLNFVRYFDVNVPSDVFESGTSTAGGAAGSPTLLRDSCEKSCTLTYPEIRYTYDGRDNVLEPTRGFYITFDVQQTLKPGSFTYFKIEPEVRGYLSLFQKTVVLAGRIDYGAILLPSGDKSPATERFFAGGANSNRGYGAYRQGPKYGAAPRGFSATGIPGDVAGGTYSAAIPAGGNGLFLVSGEMRVRTDFIFKNLALVAFVDASKVTATAELPWQSVLEVAPGIGVRYITPFGPIRVDVGYLLNPQDQLAVNRAVSVFGPLVTQPTVVSAGCNEDKTMNCVYERRWAFHLTLGEAF